MDRASPHTSRITNLSLRGLGLLTSEEIAMGSRLRVQFALPRDDQPLVIDGIVRWQAPRTGQDGAHPIGMEFEPLDDTTRFCLQAFVGDQIQQSGRFIGRVGRTVSRLQYHIPARVIHTAGWLLGGLLLASLSVWILTLLQQQERLQQTVAERTALVTQLEARHRHLETQLQAANRYAADSLAELERLHQHAASLEGEVRWLAQNLNELTQAYLRVREDRAQLHTQVARLEQQQAALMQRWQSIPDLRQAIQETRRAQRQQHRQARLQEIERLREAARSTAQHGNRGYVVYQGRPTLSSSRLSIRVYTPEPSQPSP